MRKVLVTRNLGQATRCSPPGVWDGWAQECCTCVSTFTAVINAHGGSFDWSTDWFKCTITYVTHRGDYGQLPHVWPLHCLLHVRILEVKFLLANLVIKFPVSIGGVHVLLVHHQLLNAARLVNTHCTVPFAWPAEWMVSLCLQSKVI